LPDHEVATVQALGWSGTKNGQLLRKAVDAGFEVFLTMDDNLAYQQDLSAFKIAVIVLRSRRGRLEDLLPLMPEGERSLQTAPPGKRTDVGS
jgi:hypothetical protein